MIAAVFMAAVLIALNKIDEAQFMAAYALS
jgi:hypothetical protein